MANIPTPSFMRVALSGSIRFGIASVLVYATVAFAEREMYQTLGRYGAYAAWTILFIGLGAFSLQPLAPQSKRGIRFVGIFATAFFLYAIGWTASYFILRGAIGEWVGSLAGCALMALSFSISYGSIRLAARLAAILFLANTIGYFAGSLANESFPSPVGMLLWGVFHGLGLGAGLGASFYAIRKTDEYA